MLSVAITFGIVLALIRPVVDFFAEVPFGDFFAVEGEYAVLPLVGGTLMTTFIALLVAVPLGLGAAMYLAEYANKRTRKILKPTVELLAGVPSVVYGFFALAFVTPTLLQDLLNMEVGFTNALSAGLVLGRDDHPDHRLPGRGRADRRPSGAASGLAGDGRQPDADHAAGGLPCGAVGNRRRDRARALPGDRRDHDRGAGGRCAEEPQPATRARACRP